MDTSRQHVGVEDHTKFTVSQKKNLSYLFGNSEIEYFPTHINVIKRFEIVPHSWGFWGEGVLLFNCHKFKTHDDIKNPSFREPAFVEKLIEHKVNMESHYPPDNPVVAARRWVTSNLGKFSKKNQFVGGKCFDFQTITFTFEIVAVPNAYNKGEAPEPSPWSPLLGAAYVYKSNLRALYSQPKNSRKNGKLEKGQIVIVLNSKVHKAKKQYYWYMERGSILTIPDGSRIESAVDLEAKADFPPTSNISSHYSVRPQQKDLNKEMKERAKLVTSHKKNFFPCGAHYTYLTDSRSEANLVSGWVQVSGGSGTGWIHIVNKPVSYFKECFFDHRDPKFEQVVEEKKASYEKKLKKETELPPEKPKRRRRR